MGKTWFNMGPFKMILNRGRYKQAENRGSMSSKKTADKNLRDIDKLNKMYSAFAGKRR